MPLHCLRLTIQFKSGLKYLKMFIGRTYWRAGSRVCIVGHLLDEMGINSRGKWRRKVANLLCRRRVPTAARLRPYRFRLLFPASRHIRNRPSRFYQMYQHHQTLSCCILYVSCYALNGWTLRVLTALPLSHYMDCIDFPCSAATASKTQLVSISLSRLVEIKFKN